MVKDSHAFWNRRQALSLVVLAVVFVIGASLSFAGYKAQKQRELVQTQLELERDANTYANILQVAFGDAENELAAVARLFAAADTVGLKEFRTFVRPMLDSYPGTWALTWVERVPGAERDLFEQAASEEIFPGFEIRERNSEGNIVRAKTREEYFPIHYSESIETAENIAVWGVDPLADPSRRLAFLKARDTGQLSATGPIRPLSDSFGNNLAVAAVQPIYQKGRAVDTVAERRSAIKGFVVALYRISTLVEAPLKDLPSRSLDLYLYEVAGESKNNLFYFPSSRTGSKTVSPLGEETLRADLHVVHKMKFANRDWEAIFSPVPGFFVTDNNQAFLALGGGLLLTILLLLYLHTVLLQNNRIRFQVATQTAELRRRQAEFRTVFDTIDSGVIVIDAGGLIQIFNHAAEAMFHYRPAEVLGKNISMLMTKANSVDHDQYIRSYFDTGEKKIIGIGRDVTAVRRGGEEFSIHLAIEEIVRSGQRSFVGTIIDITERKRTAKELEERNAQFQSAFEHAAHGMALVMTKGIFLRVNEAFCQMVGYSRDELLSANSRKITHLDDVDLGPIATQQLFDGETDSVQLEKRFIHKDGHVVPVRLSMSLVKDRNEKPLYCVSQIQDLTALKESEALLRQSQKMEAVGQLTGGVAHDFNNLLAIIEGNLSLLGNDLDEGRDLSTEDIRESVRPALKASKRGAELTHRLLAFSRKQALQPVVLNVNSVVQGMEGLLRRTLGEDIDLAFHLDCDDWLTEADPSELENVLLNLALNARDAMSGGGGKMTIETGEVILDDEYAASHAEVTAGDSVMLAVSDTGIGMDAETLERVFEPFYTTKDIGKGTGLGLSMVYGFAKQSSGHVALYSEVGKGTTAKLYLPRAAVADADNPEKKHQALSEGGRERILVVEDDEDVRRMAIRILNRLGYRVLAAEDGRSALAILNGEGQIDLLLTDVVLPGGMSGPDVVKAAQETYPTLDVLYMSGYTENAILHHGRLDEGVNLIGKPFSHIELGAKVREVLDSPS